MFGEINEAKDNPESSEESEDNSIDSIEDWEEDDSTEVPESLADMFVISRIALFIVFTSSKSNANETPRLFKHSKIPIHSHEPGILKPEHVFSFFSECFPSTEVIPVHRRSGWEEEDEELINESNLHKRSSANYPSYIWEPNIEL